MRQSEGGYESQLAQTGAYWMLHFVNIERDAVTLLQVLEKFLPFGKLIQFKMIQLLDVSMPLGHFVKTCLDTDEICKWEIHTCITLCKTIGGKIVDTKSGGIINCCNVKEVYEHCLRHVNPGSFQTPNLMELLNYNVSDIVTFAPVATEMVTRMDKTLVREAELYRKLERDLAQKKLEMKEIMVKEDMIKFNFKFIGLYTTGFATMGRYKLSIVHSYLCLRKHFCKDITRAILKLTWN